MGAGKLNLDLLKEEQVPLKDNHWVIFIFFFLIVQPGHIVVHAFSLSAWEAEAGVSLTLRQA